MSQPGAPTGRPPLTLYLLGAPRLERDGQPVVLDTRKALALLAYLALTGQAQTRDSLVGVLWPDYDETHARATLRRTLSTLNKALQGEGLRTGRASISLDIDSLWVDALAFQGQLARCSTHGHRPTEVCADCIAPLETAVSLYANDFLAGFSLRDSPEFDEWQMAQAQALRREMASALDRLARGLSALGEYERAIGYARRWVALDRLHEPAHRLLMRLYGWAGQRTAALRQYRDCMQALERDLGVAPLEETTLLYNIIKENRLPEPERWESYGADEAAAAPSRTAARYDERAPGPVAEARERAAPRPSVQEYPLVGRETEWRALADLYTSVVARGSGGRVVLLEGEAGIGKTRLAEEFVQWAKRAGASVVATRCYEGEVDLTYGPIIALLRAGVAERGEAWLRELPDYWLSEVARLLPEVSNRVSGRPSPQSLETPGARSRFLEGMRQALFAACAGIQPGIFFIDDAQWADSASLDLLVYIIRRLQAQQVLVLLTCRTEALASAQHLRRAVAEQQRAGRGARLVLGRLGEKAIQSLVQAAAPAGQHRPEIVERLRDETEGVPLLLVEYLLGLAQGTLGASDDQWVPRGGARQLLDSRLSAIGETSRQVLSAAAVIGRSFDFDALRAASGRSEDETIAALEELVRHGLVQEVKGPQVAGVLMYDFTHDKLRALAYEETSLARRRLLHRRVAEALAQRSKSRADLETHPEQIAHHYLEAGEVAAAARFYVIAGERARRLYAHVEALEHFSTALALGHPDAATLHAEIADLYTMLGEYGKAITSFEMAAALAGPPALASIEHRLGTVYARRGEWELAESHLAAALDALGTDDAEIERARILADQSLTAHHRGQTEKARTLARHALDLAEASQDTGALAQAYNILGILASRTGDLTAARDYLERSLALAEHLGDMGARTATLNNLALALAAEGETEQALEHEETALALSVAQGDRHREAALHNNLADLLHSAGRSEEALAHVRQAVTIYSDIGVEAGTLQPAIWKLSEW